MTPIIYVAGPYRGRSTIEVDINIGSAKKVALMMASKGWYPVTPHLLTPRFDDATGNQLKDDFFLSGSMELMARCDAVVLCPGWTGSEGATAEAIRAKDLAIPVWKSPDEVPCAKRWIGASVTTEAARKSVLPELMGGMSKTLQQGSGQ